MVNFNTGGWDMDVVFKDIIRKVFHSESFKQISAQLPQTKEHFYGVEDGDDLDTRAMYESDMRNEYEMETIQLWELVKEHVLIFNRLSRETLTIVFGELIAYLRKNNIIMGRVSALPTDHVKDTSPNEQKELGH